MIKTQNIKVNEINSVYDGDTFRATVKPWGFLGDNAPFRIARIDTPEIRGSSRLVKISAYQARDFVRFMFEQAKDIRIDVLKKRDKYGRILVDVRCDGVDVGKALIQGAMALPYDGGTKQKW